MAGASVGRKAPHTDEGQRTAPALLAGWRGLSLRLFWTVPACNRGCVPPVCAVGSSGLISVRRAGVTQSRPGRTKIQFWGRLASRIARAAFQQIQYSTVSSPCILWVCLEKPAKSPHFFPAPAEIDGSAGRSGIFRPCTCPINGDVLYFLSSNQRAGGAHEHSDFRQKQVL